VRKVANPSECGAPIGVCCVAVHHAPDGCAAAGSSPAIVAGRLVNALRAALAFALYP